MPDEYRQYFDPEWETSDPEALAPKVEERLVAQIFYTYKTLPSTAENSMKLV